MSRKVKGLDQEDQRLWSRVAKSTTPLPEQRRNLYTDLAEMLDSAEPEQRRLPPAFRKIKAANPVLPGKAVSPPPVVNPVSHPIDNPTLKKLAKGRQKIDARIDLHGMTQDRARSALLDFLTLARAANHRIVLVITGKGNLGTGILKQRVPDWLSTPPFAALVNGHRTSHASHGGEGALYVRVRRNRTKYQR